MREIRVSARNMHEDAGESFGVPKISDDTKNKLTLQRTLASEKRTKHHANDNDAFHMSEICVSSMHPGLRFRQEIIFLAWVDV
jgi:hypothetical protein